MNHIDSKTTSQKINNKAVSKKIISKTKLLIAVIFFTLSGVFTLNYLDSNIFYKYIAICAFIISCISLIKYLENE